MKDNTEVTLHYKEGNSDKFYKVLLRGVEVVCRYGRMYSTGTCKTYRFSTSQEAASFAHVKLTSKKNKGYIEVKSGAAMPTKEASFDEIKNIKGKFLL
jgi:predicted DNA-binding WGR domain protein